MTTKPEFEACLKQTAEYLTGAGIRVAIIRDVATHKQHIPQQLAQAVDTQERCDENRATNARSSQK